MMEEYVNTLKATVVESMQCITHGILYKDQYFERALPYFKNHFMNLKTFIYMTTKAEPPYPSLVNYFFNYLGLLV